MNWIELKTWSFMGLEQIKLFECWVVYNLGFMSLFSTDVFVTFGYLLVPFLRTLVFVFRATFLCTPLTLITWFVNKTKNPSLATCLKNTLEWNHTLTPNKNTSFGYLLVVSNHSLPAWRSADQTLPNNNIMFSDDWGEITSGGIFSVCHLRPFLMFYCLDEFKIKREVR